MPLHRSGSVGPRRNALASIRKCGRGRPGLATRPWHACFRSGVSSVPRRTARSHKFRIERSRSPPAMAERPSLLRLFPLGVGIHPADGAALHALDDDRLVERSACLGTKMASATPLTAPSARPMQRVKVKPCPDRYRSRLDCSTAQLRRVRSNVARRSLHVAIGPAHPRTNGLSLTGRQTSASRRDIRCTARSRTRQAIRIAIAVRTDRASKVA